MSLNQLKEARWFQALLLICAVSLAVLPELVTLLPKHAQTLSTLLALFVRLDVILRRGIPTATGLFPPSSSSGSPSP